MPEPSAAEASELDEALQRIVDILGEQEAVHRIAEELPGLIDAATPEGDTAALDSLASTTASAAYPRAYPGSAHP